MKKIILAVGILSATVLISCKDNKTQENTDLTNTEQTTSKDVVTESLTNKDGETLEMSFDNSEGTATVNFKGETIDLEQQRSGSGIWYKNEQYELRGKGNDISLSKDGKVVFEHEDDKVNVEAKNDKGDVLTMTFNNTVGTVRAYLNGGEQIDLKQKKAASGIWYENDEYELRGKGDNYMLIKDGETVFEN